MPWADQQIYYNQMRMLLTTTYPSGLFLLTRPVRKGASRSVIDPNLLFISTYLAPCVFQQAASKLSNGLRDAVSVLGVRSLPGKKSITWEWS